MHQPPAANSSARFLLVAAGLLGALAVILGAFGAHGLEDRLSPRGLEIWETAVRYHMYHALMLLGVGILQQRRGRTSYLVAGLLAIAGIAIFSGLLYLLALTEISILGAIVPIGGLALIAAWIALVVGVFRDREPN